MLQLPFYLPSNVYILNSPFPPLPSIVSLSHKPFYSQPNYISLVNYVRFGAYLQQLSLLAAKDVNRKKGVAEMELNFPDRGERDCSEHFGEFVDKS